MTSDSIEAIASVAESLSTLALALSFIFYLVRQIAVRDDIIFNDWQRQRDKEATKP